MTDMASKLGKDIGKQYQVTKKKQLINNALSFWSVTDV